MAIDIIARGLAGSLLDADGKISAKKMPTLPAVSESAIFYPIGGLQDPGLIEGKTAEEILLMLLYGIVNPTLTDPSLSIALSDENTQLIIGRPTMLKGTLTFNRGKIDPAFTTSGYRAGAPITYSIGEYTFESNSALYDFDIELTPTATQISLPYSVAYGEGEQPVNSIGQPVDAPLSAGLIQDALNLTASYALYDASGSEQSFEWFEDEAGQGYLCVATSEGSGQKQSFAVASSLNVVGIKTFNPMMQQWEWLGGSANASLTHFDTTLISGESLGETTNYILYTHNQPAKGERKLRIYVLQ